MEDVEYEILAEIFDTPCDFSPMDDYMAENCHDWCAKNCGIIKMSECWKKFLKLKIEDRYNNSVHKAINDCETGGE